MMDNRETTVIDHLEAKRAYIPYNMVKRPDLRLWIHSARIPSHTEGHDCLTLEFWNSYWRLNLGPSAWVQSETYNTIVARVEFLNSVVWSITVLSNTGGGSRFPGFYNFNILVQRFYCFIITFFCYFLFAFCSVCFHFIVKYVYIVFQFDNVKD